MSNIFLSIRAKLFLAGILLVFSVGYTGNKVLHHELYSDGTVFLLVVCLALILAVFSLVLVDVFLPLHNISSLLVRAGNDAGNIEKYLKLSNRKDEIGRAQNALYNLLQKMSSALSEDERKIAAIEASKGGIGITDSKGNLVFANRALFEIHGIPFEESEYYFNAPSLNLFDKKEREKISEAVFPILEKEGLWQGEIDFTAMDGSERHGDFSLTRLEDGSIIGTVIDITSRKITEKEKENVEALFIQAQKMESIGRLTGGIAHDFNNMLTIIRGNLELLQETAIHRSPKANHYVETALRAVERSSELTSHLLSFSKKQFLLPKTISVNRFLPEASMLLTRALGEDVELVFNLGENIWNIKVDAGQLETAILNLVINARDAMGTEGMIIINTENVTLTGAESLGRFHINPGDYVRLRVADTGHGMSEEVLSNVFDPFFTTKEVGKGTGLGLSMVYGFIKQSGGYIMIDSKEGVGTNIDLYFPKSGYVAEDTNGGSQQWKQQSFVASCPGKILIAEDEKDLLELNKNILTNMGYKVLCAEDGETALDLLQKNKDIDMILSDMVMPGGMSGRDLAKEARKMKPDIKILLVSGYSQELNGHDLGDDIPHVLPKPYTQARLASEVNALMMDAPKLETVNAS